MDWIDARHDQPDYGRYVLAGSLPHRDYVIACVDPCRGWVSAAGEQLGLITHWYPLYLDLPFDATEPFDEQSALQYGYKAKNRKM